MKEMNGADDAQDDEENEVDDLMHSDLGIIEQFLVVDKLDEMIEQVIQCVGICVIARCKPVGGDDTEDGSEESAEAEVVGTCQHHQP